MPVLRVSKVQGQVLVTLTFYNQSEDDAHESCSQGKRSSLRSLSRERRVNEWPVVCCVVEAILGVWVECAHGFHPFAMKCHVTFLSPSKSETGTNAGDVHFYLMTPICT